MQATLTGNSVLPILQKESHPIRNLTRNAKDSPKTGRYRRNTRKYGKEADNDAIYADKNSGKRSIGTNI